MTLVLAGLGQLSAGSCGNVSKRFSQRKRWQAYDSGIALEVDVERDAAVDGIALGRARLGVIAVERGVAHVSIRTAGGLQILEGVEVACRCGRILGRCGEVRGAQERGRGVRARDRAGAGGLRVARPAHGETPLAVLRLHGSGCLRERAGHDLGDDAGSGGVGVVGHDGLRGGADGDGGVGRGRSIVDDLPDEVLGFGERGEGADEGCGPYFGGVKRPLDRYQVLELSLRKGVGSEGAWGDCCVSFMSTRDGTPHLIYPWMSGDASWIIL